MLHWEGGVLATGPPEKSPSLNILFISGIRVFIFISLGFLYLTCLYLAFWTCGIQFLITVLMSLSADSNIQVSSGSVSFIFFPLYDGSDFIFNKVFSCLLFLLDASQCGFYHFRWYICIIINILNLGSEICFNYLEMVSIFFLFLRFANRD